MLSKILQIKVVKHWSLYKKVSRRICLSPLGVKLGGSKDCHLWNIMFKNGKVDSLWGSMLLKIRVISRNASYKSCWASNSVQKIQWAHMSTALQSGSRRLQRLICFKYYIILILKVDSVWARRCQKYKLYEKRLQINIAKHWISYKAPQLHSMENFYL